MTDGSSPYRHSNGYLEGIASLVGQLPVAVFTCDPELRLTSSSGAALKGIGLEPGAHIGTSMFELFGTTDGNHPVIRAHHKSLAGHRVQFDTEFGGHTWHVVLQPLRSDAGDIIGTVGLAMDVSERREAEEELRRSEAQFRALVLEAPVGIFRSTTEGRFIMANPALVSMLGYDSEEELRGLDLAAQVYVQPGLRDELIRQFQNTDRVSGVEVEWRRKDGTRFVVRLSGRPVRDAEGKVVAWQMVAEDVTERRRLEAQLRTAQKMEALGLVTGGVAHDFNNLLTTIMANAELIASALPASMAQTRSDLLEIQDAAARGSDLVKKLLGFSRRERLTMQATNCGALVQDLLEVIRGLLPDYITVSATVEPDLPAALADPGALQQMILSLAYNARDAIAEHGEIVLEARRARLDEGFIAEHGWGTPGDYVAISVRDTGFGMDEETRQRAFEPFFTTKPPGAGSGLGLAMVYGLMKQQNGFVELRSSPGRGTVVTLYLPQTGRTPAAQPLIPFVRHAGQTVLVVEDEEPIRRVATRVLERHGYKVIAAVDGLEALQLFRENEAQVSLILTDVVMPRMGGRALLETLRAAGKKVPVIFTSGYARAEAPETADIDPAIPYLPKPWSVEQLVAVVREVVGD